MDISLAPEWQTFAIGDSWKVERDCFGVWELSIFNGGKRWNITLTAEQAAQIIHYVRTEQTEKN